jgi:zinc transporter ZupT
MLTSPLAVGLTVFGLCLGAGFLPVFLRLGARVLHAVVAVACGLFLGITFLHLLPEVARLAADPQRSGTALWGCVLAGLLAVFVADVALRAREDEHHEGDHPAHHGGHRVVGFATFVGLSIHTLGGAVGIGLGFEDERLRGALVAATLAHKAAEAFSLASVLLLAELPRRAIAGLLVAYALVTPAGIAIGRGFASGLAPGLLGPAEGLAAGTFLYVAVAELLPEVFHGRTDRGMKVALLLGGIAASTALLAAGPH